MASFNRVILIGNLTRDPEIKYLPSGMAVSEIGLAINDRRKGQNGEWIEETTFVDITLWGRTAEVVSEYVTKGSPLFVEGRLKLDQWEKDGKKNYKLKVIGDRIQLIGAKGGGGGNSGGGGQRSAPSRPPQRGSQSSQGSQGDDYSQSGPSESYYDAGPEPSGGGNGGGGSGGGDDIPF